MPFVARRSLIAVVALATLCAGGWFVVAGADTEPVSAAQGASLSCDAETVEYGIPLTCVQSPSDLGEIHWGDGQIGGTTHTIRQVGVVPLEVRDADGIVLAATQVHLRPDLKISCELDKWKNVYAVAPTDSTDTGWDYVYLHPDTGASVGPAHVDHPTDPGLTDLELVVLDRVQEVGECTATSQAAEDLDGDFEFTMGTVWDEHSVPFRQLTPWSNDHWKGTQPGFIDVAVTVNETTVSERRDVHLSGCT